MKNFIKISAITLLALFGSNCAQSQISWGDFPALTSQLDSTQRAELLLQVVDLKTDGLSDSLLQSGSLDSLFAALDSDNPNSNLDSLVTDWLKLKEIISDSDGLFESLEKDTLNNLVDSTALALDSSSLKLQMTFDSLDLSAIDQLSIEAAQDSLSISSQLIEEGQQNSIENYQNTSQDTEDSESRLINLTFAELFSPGLRVEVYAGISTGITKYYGRNFNFDALSNPSKVIGLRSAAIYDQLWQVKWDFSTSWVAEDILENNDPETLNNDPSSKQTLYNADGNFAIMMNPGINLGKTLDARILTSFGFEVARHVPDYRAFNEAPRSTTNRGNNTALGPQLGAGFSIQLGELSLTSLASIATGTIFEGEYQYGSFKSSSSLVVDRFSVTYQYSTQSFAEGQNKVMNFNQLTVGYQIY